MKWIEQEERSGGGEEERRRGEAVEKNARLEG
jgi:hypothetical protein